MTEGPVLETERLLLREHVERWGVFEDLEVYGILAGERLWRSASRSPYPAGTERGGRSDE